LQQDSEYESDLEQQQGCKYDSHLESNSSTFADFSMDKDACLVYDQFSKHVEHIITDDCIDSYMFLADHNYQCDLNPVVPLSCDHHAENKETAIVDDQNLISREPEGCLFSSKEECMYEQLSFLNQQVSNHGLEDPIAAYMESYVSDCLKIPVFIISQVFMGKHVSLKEFLSLFSDLCYSLLISGMDGIPSVMKLLEWLLWKFSFT
jgi:hypothetical protein